MIPTDEAMAATKGVRTRADGSKSEGWKMPFAPLFARLNEVTGHRVLRADRDKDALDAEEPAGRAASARRWAAFRPRVRFADMELVRDRKTEKDKPAQPLYVEYTIPQRADTD